MHTLLWQLEPSDAETELISLLLNATVAFFRDEDTEDTPTAPPTKFPPHLGLKPYTGVWVKKHYSECLSIFNEESVKLLIVHVTCTQLLWSASITMQLRS